MLKSNQTIYSSLYPNKNIILGLLCFMFILVSCNSNDSEAVPEDMSGQMSDPDPSDDAPALITPLFINSIVSTDINFITATDPDAFVSVAFLGREDKEMPDSRNDILFDEDTFVFEATFSNNKKVGIWVHSSFDTEAAAQEYVDKVTSRLGKLPEFMRDILLHVVIHNGDAGAFAESEGHFFVLYSDNMDTRISNNDLEETVFHETIHASLDSEYLTSAAWTSAQAIDGVFITEYGEEFSEKEDMAESAIFAYTMIKYPNRLDPSIETWVNQNIPNRLSFFRTIFE